MPPKSLDAVAVLPVQLPELPEQFPDRFPEKVVAYMVPLPALTLQLLVVMSRQLIDPLTYTLVKVAAPFVSIVAV